MTTTVDQGIMDLFGWTQVAEPGTRGVIASTIQDNVAVSAPGSPAIVRKQAEVLASNSMAHADGANEKEER